MEALLINAVDPTVGGVLVRGEARDGEVDRRARPRPSAPAGDGGAQAQPFAFAPGEAQAFRVGSSTKGPRSPTARQRSSNCPSAPPSTAYSARSTSVEPWLVITPSKPACWARSPPGESSTSTK